MSKRTFLAAVFLVVLTLTCPASRLLAGQVPCTTVISAVNRHTTEAKGKPADISRLAKQLGSNVPWVEHCMRTYGRRPRRPGLESEEKRERLIEAYEENEPEEAASEDVEEPGTREDYERHGQAVGVPPKERPPKPRGHEDATGAEDEGYWNR